MLGSMYSAVSGLSAHQTKMNVIGNNIANVNTYGYKASRVTFADVFYQTMTGASAPTTNGGGTNPTQLGYGSKVSSIDVINKRAGSATTDRALDVYINGDGYLPVKTGDGAIKYTRIGVLSFDLAGNLVDRNGNQVLGFALDGTTKNAKLNNDGTTNVQNLVGIKVDPAQLDKYTGIAIGKNGEITGIKEGDPTVTPAASTGWMNGTPTVPKTSLYSGDLNMTVTRGPNVQFSAGTYKDDTALDPGAVTVASGADLDGPISIAYNYDATGPSYTYTLSGTAKDGTAVSATVTSATPLSASQTFDLNGTGTVTLNLPAFDTSKLINGETQEIGNVVPTTMNITAKTYDKSGAEVNLTATWNWGDTSITLGDITIPVDAAEFGALEDGDLANTRVAGIAPGPGIPEKVAHLAAVKFINPDGLSQDGDSYFVETTNSGSAVATVPGNGGTGNFMAGSVEMSNVDLSREFTEMIITQRGFQANTRMITVSDEMLSELVSMKR